MTSAERERQLARSAARLEIDVELFCELLGLFLDHSEVDCGALDAALAAGDLAAAGRAAHSLKGAALALRLEEATDLARRLEDLADRGDGRGAGAVAVAVRDHLGELRGILDSS